MSNVISDDYFSDRNIEKIKEESRKQGAVEELERLKEFIKLDKNKLIKFMKTEQVLKGVPSYLEGKFVKCEEIEVLFIEKRLGELK